MLESLTEYGYTKGLMIMSETMNKAFALIDSSYDEMIELYRKIVTMETPSANREGLQELAEVLAQCFRDLHMNAEIHHYAKGGPAVTAESEPAELAPIALVGHYDTVHPVGSFGPDPFIIEGDIVKGPGVFDMKGGIVIMLYAIKALQSVGYNKRQFKVMLAGDEEVAHAFSNGECGRLIEEHAKGCVCAFNCESGAPKEEVSTRRKGGAVFEVEVFGKAAHAGKEPEKGASAILQAAHMISEIESHTVIGDMTFNCGKIAGGTGSNIIPDYCTFTVAVRYCTNAQYDEAVKMLNDLCENVTVKGTRCTIRANGFYPAMELTERTEDLMEIYRTAAKMLDRPVPEGLYIGGCSDSAFTTRAGVPTVCSAGPQGEYAHSRNEFAYLSSLAIQCKKIVASILMLPDNF